MYTRIAIIFPVSINIDLFGWFLRWKKKKKKLWQTLKKREIEDVIHGLRKFFKPKMRSVLSQPQNWLTCILLVDLADDAFFFHKKRK